MQPWKPLTLQIGLWSLFGSAKSVIYKERKIKRWKLANLLEESDESDEELDEELMRERVFPRGLCRASGECSRLILLFPTPQCFLKLGIISHPSFKFRETNNILKSLSHYIRTAGPKMKIAKRIRTLRKREQSSPNNIWVSVASNMKVPK